MRYFFVTLLVIPFFVQAQQWRNVLIGTYTGSGSHGIYSAKVNIKTGALQLHDSIAVENPSFLAFSPNKKFVYAVIENGKDKPGKVAAFAYDSKSAKLTFLNEVLSGGDHPCHLMVHPSGKALAVANYTGGNFSIIQINADGSLSSYSKTIQHYGKSVDTIRQNSPHVHQTVFSSKGDLLYVTDLGIDKVKVYKVNNENDVIKVNTEVYDELQVKAGSGPRHIALNKQENKVYILNELVGSVDVFVKGINAKYSLASTAKADTISKKSGSAQIVINKKNNYLYVSNRADANTIAVFKVNRNNRLTLIQTISTNGIKPRNFILTPNEKFILAANQVSSNINVFKVNKNGTLTNTNQSLQVPNPVCILID
jgi:6-phosphogluconolactonase